MPAEACRSIAAEEAPAGAVAAGGMSFGAQVTLCSFFCGYQKKAFTSVLVEGEFRQVLFGCSRRRRNCQIPRGAAG